MPPACSGDAAGAQEHSPKCCGWGMAPPGWQRSRRRPAVLNGLIESRRQQNCETAARQVAVARLTRPADSLFKNQRESLRAKRNEAAALVPLSRRLEQDLLSLVCEKKRDDQRSSSRQRFVSPTVSSRREERGERRDYGEHQGQRRRQWKTSGPRRRVPSSSPSSSSSSSDRSRGKRRRRRHRRSHRSGSPEERGAAVRAPLSAAPTVRASLRRARQFTPPRAVRTGVATRGGGGSADRRQQKTADEERREEAIVGQTLRELHSALDDKRRQVPWNKSVLAKVRSYCIEVARQAQSELPPSEDLASPSSELLEQDTLEMEECVPDPEFVVDVPSMEDEVVVVELSSGSQTASPASSLQRDSPREDEHLPFCEEAAEEEEFLDRRLDRREEEDDDEEPGDVVDPEFWPRPGLPGTSSSSFLVPWNRPAPGPAGPRLVAPPLPCVAPSASCSSSFRQDEFLEPRGAGAADDWRRAARLPPPVAPTRLVEHSYSYMYPVATAPAPSPAFTSPWSTPAASGSALRGPLTPMFPSALGAPLAPPPRPPPTRPLPPPPDPWERPAEEFITVFTPAEGRPARRCFSPTPDRPRQPPLQYVQQRSLYYASLQPMDTSPEHQADSQYRAQGLWRLPGRRMF